MFSLNLLSEKWFSAVFANQNVRFFLLYLFLKLSRTVFSISTIQKLCQNSWKYLQSKIFFCVFCMYLLKAKFFCVFLEHLLSRSWDKLYFPSNMWAEMFLLLYLLSQSWAKQYHSSMYSVNNKLRGILVRGNCLSPSLPGALNAAWATAGWVAMGGMMGDGGRRACGRVRAQVCSPIPTSAH